MVLLYKLLEIQLASKIRLQTVRTDLSVADDHPVLWLVSFRVVRK